MRHLCGTCGELYGCPRNEPACGSPYVYDCHACYWKRYWRELELALQALADRLGSKDGGAGFGEFCNAD